MENKGTAMSKTIQISIFIILAVLSFGQLAYPKDLVSAQENFTQVTDELYVLKGVSCNVAGNEAFVTRIQEKG